MSPTGCRPSIDRGGDDDPRGEESFVNAPVQPHPRRHRLLLLLPRSGLLQPADEPRPRRWHGPGLRLLGPLPVALRCSHVLRRRALPQRADPTRAPPLRHPAPAPPATRFHGGLLLASAGGSGVRGCFRRAGALARAGWRRHGFVPATVGGILCLVREGKELSMPAHPIPPVREVSDILRTWRKTLCFEEITPIQDEASI